MEEKYYTRSNGELVKINEMETTHLINSLSKSYRDIFACTDEEEFNNKINSINDLKEEVYKRINNFHEGMGNNNGE